MSRERNGQSLRRALAAGTGIVLIAAGLHFIDAGIRPADPTPEVQISQQQINYGDEYLIYDIRMPIVSGFADAGFEDTLNERIKTQIAQDLAAAKSYAKDYMEQVRTWTIPPYDCVFSAWYEAKCTAGILSLKVTTFLDNGGTGMPHTVYYNADIARSKMLTLGDLFTTDEYKARINIVIDTEMRKFPQRYDVPFKGVTADTQFFISGGRLFIAFAKYEVADGMAGEPEFEIPMEKMGDILKAGYKEIFD